MKTFVCVWWTMLLLSGSWVQAEEQTVTVQLLVPDATWRLSIEEVVEVEDELWVLACVSQADGMMGIQVISMVEAEKVIEAGDLPVKIFVLGKTWAWENEEPYTFLKTREAIAESLRQGLRIFPGDAD